MEQQGGFLEIEDGLWAILTYDRQILLFDYRNGIVSLGFPVKDYVDNMHYPSLSMSYKNGFLIVEDRYLRMQTKICGPCHWIVGAK